MSSPSTQDFAGHAITLTLNGQARQLNVQPWTTLLDLLRDQLDLVGTKKGCDHGQCGACTVLRDGKRINSCLTLAIMCDGAELTTIEGLADGDQLHPMQQAFIKHDAFQCGYCTPGQICSAVAVLDEIRQGIPSHASPSLTDRPELIAREFQERMSGNICRCGAYKNILAAVQSARGKLGRAV